MNIIDHHHQPIIVEEGQYDDNPHHHHLNEGQNDHLLLPGESHARMAARFKDHRQSYGLEFIDIRKEINAELRQIGGGGPRKYSPKGTGKTSKAAKENKSSNLRFVVGREEGGLDRSTIINSEKAILTGGHNLRGSKSQKHAFTLNNDSSVMNETSVNADLNVSRAMIVNTSSITH